MGTAAGVQIPNLDGWLTQIFRDQSDRRINKVVNFLFRPEHDAAGRRQALRVVIEAVASGHIYSVSTDSPRFKALADAIIISCIERGEMMIVDELVTREIDIMPAPFELVRVHLLIRLLLHISSSPANTQMFCRMAFPACNEQLRKTLRCGLRGFKSIPESAQPRLLWLIQDSCHCVEHLYKAWITNLIQLAADGDVAAVEWLWFVFQVVGVGSPQFNMMSVSNIKQLLKAEGKTVADHERTPFNSAHPIWVVEDRQLTAMTAYMASYNQRWQIAREKAGEWCRWFQHGLPEIAPVMRRHREQIRTEPARLIRKNGRDRVDVHQLSLVQDLGIQSITFLPNGSPWPDMDIVFHVRRLGCMEYELRGSLLDLNIHLPASILESIPEDTHELRRLALEFVIIECLHRIVVRQQFDHTANGNGHNGNGTRRVTGACAHFPRLPDGKSARPETIDRCLKDTGFVPPAGRTYNEGWEPEGGELIVETRPRLVLHDEQLQH
ncbi:MAG: hypothetical protein HZC01_01965 [Candidatus Kerfeldbacteria bacterium]|nr:hypothetical protein [Candidatus Kerfeldbacteria bacterium]